MLDETFYLDGVDARSVGICLQKSIDFSEPVPVSESIQVAGRNGNLTIFSGSFENRRGRAKCYILGENVSNLNSGVNGFLLNSQSYKKLETSNDVDHFWMARVANGARIENRKGLLNPFDIEFDCKPQRFLKDGEYELTYILPSGKIFPNPTAFNAKPIIIVNGVGTGSVSINGVTITIEDVRGTVCIDCESQNAYYGAENRNNDIYAEEFPELPPGSCEYMFDGGVESISVIPRWWTL